MAIRYLDLENGNDANDGTTFALRKKTLAACTGLAYGDEVRVMTSPDPVSMGINATFTLGSDVVTLASAVTATIDNCESAWTASANVTATASTSTYRQGAASANLVIASAFTTGLAAYKALGSAVDFSGYQQISLLVRTSAAMTAGRLELRLCSDTAGITAVNTIALPALAINLWTPVTVNVGAALGNAIQSVALYVTVDGGSATVNIDNIIACKAASSPDALTHISLIGKNSGASEPWMAVHYIDGTSVGLAHGRWDTATPNSSVFFAKYGGTTETVAAYRRECIVLAAAETTPTGVGGSYGYLTPFRVTGGWDRTAMTTQGDFTALRPATTGLAIVLINNSINLVSFSVENFLVVGVAGASGVSNSQASYVFFLNCAAVACYTNPFSANQCGNGAELTMPWAFGNHRILQISGSSDCHTKVTCPKLWGMGSSITAAGALLYDNVTSSSRYQAHLYVGAIYNLYAFVESASGAYGLHKLFVYNANGAPYRIQSLGTLDLKTYNCSAYNTSGELSLHDTNYGRVVGSHRISLTTSATSHAWHTATDQRHTASDKSWKLMNVAGDSSATGGNQAMPFALPLPRIACSANELRTVSVWIRRDNSSRNMRLVMRGSVLPGVDADVISSASGAINTWEQLSVNFTPTEDGVAELEVQAFGGSGYAWVDDMEVT